MYPYHCFVVTSDMYLSIITDGTSVSTFLCTLKTGALRNKCNCTKSDRTDLY